MFKEETLQQTSSHIVLSTTTLPHTKPSPFPTQIELISPLYCTNSASSLIIRGRGRSSPFLIQVSDEIISILSSSHTIKHGVHTLDSKQVPSPHYMPLMNNPFGHRPQNSTLFPQTEPVIQNLTSSVTHSQTHTPVGSTFNQNSIQLCTCFNNKLTEPGTARDR